LKDGIFWLVQIRSTLDLSSPYRIINPLGNQFPEHYIFMDLRDIGPLTSSTFCFYEKLIGQNDKMSKLSKGDAFDCNSLTDTTLRSAVPDHW
jgi:hypothetical protein